MQKAFSLIELMVVIAIVGILSAVAVPSYKNYIERVELSNLMNSLNVVRDKMKQYYSLNGSWPTPDEIGYSTNVGTGVFTQASTEINSNLGLVTIQYDTTSCGKFVAHIFFNTTLEIDGASFTGLRYHTGEDANGFFRTACAENSNSTYTSFCNFTTKTELTDVMCP